MSLDGGTVKVANKAGQTVWLQKSAQCNEPWQFIGNDGTPGVMVGAKFHIKNGESVTMFAGNMSVDADEGTNFFARFKDDDNAPFEAVLIYCSGEAGDSQEYWFVERAGKPYLASNEEL